MVFINPKISVLGSPEHRFGVLWGVVGHLWSRSGGNLGVFWVVGGRSGKMIEKRSSDSLQRTAGNWVAGP